MVNDNLIDLLVTPTRAGRPARFSYRPRAATLALDADVRTVAAGRPTAISFTGSAPGRIKVTGTIAAGDRPVLKVAEIADPAAFARTVFIQALRRAGVRVDARSGGPNPARRLPASRTHHRRTRVAVLVSPPYAEYAKLILKVSHNLGANLGVCLLAVTARSTDCDAGFASMNAFLRRAGVDTSQIVLADGRGGDPADRSTPTAITQILRYWTGQPDFDEFRAALPSLGVDGSPAAVATNSAARGKVFAKTGTAAAGDPLNDRVVVQAKALGGFFLQAGGAWRVFNVVVNNAGGGADLQPILDANEDVGQVAAQLWQQANP